MRSPTSVVGICLIHHTQITLFRLKKKKKKSLNILTAQLLFEELKYQVQDKNTGFLSLLTEIVCTH